MAFCLPAWFPCLIQVGTRGCRGVPGVSVGPKHIPVPGKGTFAHESEYPREEAEAVVSRDADNLEASITSLCLCLN